MNSTAGEWEGAVWVGTKQNSYNTRLLTDMGLLYSSKDKTIGLLGA